MNRRICRSVVAPLLAVALLAATPQSAPARTANASTKPASASTRHAVNVSTADTAFAALSRRWLDGSMRLSPVGATSIGDHRFNARIDDLSASGRAARLAFNRHMLAELDRLPSAKLSRENQVDALILRNQLQSELWTSETLQSWAWDPQLYNGLAGSAIYSLMARDFAPLPTRLRAATARMERLPALYAQMRANLDPARVPRIHAETVARQNKGVLDLVDQFITPNIDKLQGKDRTRLRNAISRLRRAVADNQTWLDKELVPNAHGDFRIGTALYDQKLKLALNSSLSRKQIRDRAEAELRRVRGEMYTIAMQVLKDRANAPALPSTPDEKQQQAAIEAALELAYAQHPNRNHVVPAARRALVDATRFVRQKVLVTVPKDPVKIILMPEFQRGVAVAYCDSPGPLDKGLATYFAISPIPDGWNDAQAESFLREYNTRMIHLLAIHEAMPGHYLEGVHSARHPSVLRAVLRSGPFAEGWAVYTERMMTDAGYMDRDPLFRLVQLKFYLRSVGNAILDQGVHVDGWSREQAMDFMTRQTFQQEREAAGKWVRAQLTSAQLPTYFVGAQEHFDTLDAVRQREGAKFSLKAYNDRMLSHGAPPVRFARQLMLGDSIL